MTHQLKSIVARPFQSVTDVFVSALNLMLVFGLVAACQDPDLRFSVRFHDVSGIESGDAIRFRGLEIGEVEAVGLADGLGELSVRVDALYAHEVCAHSTYRLRLDKAANAGSRYLEIDRDAAECIPLRDGAVVRGIDNRLGEFLRRGLRILEEGSEAMRESARVLQESLDQKSEELGIEIERAADHIVETLEALMETVDSSELSEDIDRMVKDLKGLVDQGAEALLDEWPEVLDRIQELIDELHEHGHGDEADRLAEELWT